MKIIDGFLFRYQKDVVRTLPEATPRENILMAAIGLSEEAGEAAGLVKKWAFQGHRLDKDKVIEEVGDDLFYAVVLLLSVGSTLEEAICRNMEKRRNRYPDGFDPERSRNRAGG